VAIRESQNAIPLRITSRFERCSLKTAYSH
jgi:hypothetical protein